MSQLHPAIPLRGISRTLPSNINTTTDTQTPNPFPSDTPSTATSPFHLQAALAAQKATAATLDFVVLAEPDWSPPFAPPPPTPCPSPAHSFDNCSLEPPTHSLNNRPPSPPIPAAAPSPTPTPPGAEFVTIPLAAPDYLLPPSYADVARWTRLFGYAATDAARRITAQRRAGAGRARVSDAHWLAVRARMEARGYDREAYVHFVERRQVREEEGGGGGWETTKREVGWGWLGRYWAWR